VREWLARVGVTSELRGGKLPPEGNHWHNENAAILERFFTGSESTEYKNCTVFGPMIAGGYDDVDDDEASWHDTRLQWLRSLRARLYLYETHAPAAADAVNTSDDSPRTSRRSESVYPVIFISHISEEATRRAHAQGLDRVNLPRAVRGVREQRHPRHPRRFSLAGGD
jgi:hypothetical protein